MTQPQVTQASTTVGVCKRKGSGFTPDLKRQMCIDHIDDNPDRGQAVWTLNPSLPFLTFNLSSTEKLTSFFFKQLHLQLTLKVKPVSLFRVLFYLFISFLALGKDCLRPWVISFVPVGLPEEEYSSRHFSEPAS